MRTSLHEIKLIDDHIFNKATIEDKLVFDAMLILDPQLDEKIFWQKRTHAAVKQYARKKLKAEIDSVHRKLFSEPKHQSFRQRILSLFN